MSMNLLDSIKGEINSTVIDKISNYLNIARGNTSNAVTAAIPSILGYLSEKSKSEVGADMVVKAATDNELATMFKGNSFQDLFGRNRDSLMAKGNSLLIDIFGGKEAKFSEEISTYANVSKEAADGILAAIFPLILNVLGNRIANEGLNKSSVSTLFEKENDAIFSAIPAGLASLGSILGFSGISSKAKPQNVESTTIKTETVKPKINTMSKQDVNEQNDRKTYIKEDEKSGGVMKWLLPLLGIIAAAALLYFLMKQCDDKEVETIPTEEVSTTEVTEQGSEPVSTLGEYDSINNRYIYNVGDDAEIELPNGETIMAGTNSTEYKLNQFLSDENKDVSDDKTQDWIVLDRVYFETGSGNLDVSSLEQLNRLVKIMNAYPNAKLKLGGYTDNSGSQDINQPLSQERADMVKTKLVAEGISADRLEAEGYGAQHFVCPENDTPECMAQNRRVDVRVTAK